MSHITGILLAAGSSRRMGRTKQLMVVDGVPLLAGAIARARASSLDDLVLVLGHAADEIEQQLGLATDAGLRVVRNPDHEQGQGRSIAVGIRQLPSEASHAAILLADQPDLDAPTIDRVLEVARRSLRPVIRPVWEVAGQRQPGHPVVFARRCWPELERLAGDRGARKLLELHPEWVEEVRLDGPAPTDLDRPEDLADRVDASRTLR